MRIGRDTVVLLGAGASAEAGVPTAFAMTDRLAERLAARPKGVELAQAYGFACDVLRRSGHQVSGNPRPDVDVERVFSAVELLAERDTLEIAQFVESWHPALCSNVHQPAIYRSLAAAIPPELRQLVLTEPGSSDYLAPLIDAGHQRGGLTIATLNYDLTVEQCAESLGVPHDTGMEGWVVYGSWMWSEDGIRLLKLHGSIAEAWGEIEHSEAFLPYQGVYGVDRPGEERQPPVLAFGQGDKLRSVGPFVGLLNQFELLTREAEKLIVIGYSFRDDHINQAIVRWSHFSTGRRITVVDPNWPVDFSSASTQDFRATLHHCLVSPQDSPAHFESRLEVRRESCSQALHSLDGSS